MSSIKGCIWGIKTNCSAVWRRYYTLTQILAALFICPMDSTSLSVRGMALVCKGIIVAAWNVTPKSIVHAREHWHTHTHIACRPPPPAGFSCRHLSVSWWCSTSSYLRVRFHFGFSAALKDSFSMTIYSSVYTLYKHNDTTDDQGAQLTCTLCFYYHPGHIYKKK